MKLRMKWKAWGIVLIAAAALAALAACGPVNNSPDPFGGKAGQQPTALTGAPEQVQAVYKQRCLSCHGGNLEGKAGPKTNLQKAGARLSKEQIAKQINTGGGGMPVFAGQLKPEEVDALAEWLAGKK